MTAEVKGRSGTRALKAENSPVPAVLKDLGGSQFEVLEAHHREVAQGAVDKGCHKPSKIVDRADKTDHKPSDHLVKCQFSRLNLRIGKNWLSSVAQSEVCLGAYVSGATLSSHQNCY